MNMVAPRYDRVVSLVFVVMIGLAIIFLIDINPNTLRIRPGFDLPIVPISWVLIGSLVVISSAGADLLLHHHPSIPARRVRSFKLGRWNLELLPEAWIIPAFCVVGSFAFFRLFGSALEGFAFALALLAAGGSLFVTLICQHYAWARDPQVRQRALVVLQIVAFLLAFSCFSAVYYARLRTLYSASLIGITATLLAYALLIRREKPQIGQLALLVGVLLAQATYSLNYWSVSFLIAGSVLLVIFYVVVNLIEQALTEQLRLRSILEYCLLGFSLLALAIYANFRA